MAEIIRVRVRIARKGTGRTVYRSTFGDWNSDDFHKRLLRTIYAQHPGWHIVGYCKIRPGEEE